jgi:hypothetical protein
MTRSDLSLRRGSVARHCGFPVDEASRSVWRMCEHTFVCSGPSGAASDRLPKITQLDLHWLAGLFEGEGSFFPGPPSCPHLPVLQMSMTDADVVGRAARLLGVNVRVITPRRPGWKTTYVVVLNGSRAVAWMVILRPLLGDRRRAQVDRALASYAPRSNRRLDDQRAREALALLADGQSVRAVAEHFGVSIWCIYDLRLGRTHKHVHRAAGQPRSVGSLPSLRPDGATERRGL